MAVLLLTIAVSLSISFLCSFLEAALYSIPWSHIENMRKSRQKAGKKLFILRSQVERPIAAILTLNTIANTAGSAIAGSLASAVFGEQYMIAFAAGFTVLILLCSEIIPKTLGMSYCRHAAVFLAYTVDAMVIALKPLIAVSTWIARLVTPQEKGPTATEEDIYAIISILRRSGRLEPYEETSIRNILALDSKSVRDIMTPRTVAFTLPADIAVQEAQKVDGFWHFSRIPVYGDNNEDIVGLISRRRVLEELADDQHARKLSDIMHPIHFVLESLPLDKLLLRFLDDRVHILVVLDEFGGMAGVVTLEDVLEEVLGREIVDETDEVPDLRELARQRRRRLLDSPKY
ncbi:MAG: hemolysin family protein [Desulfovibrio sp.]|jgi:CBS domain containing-hemolysin-like protein|nr:hemolysin family protein [Desulfovibrio sp.]